MAHATSPGAPQERRRERWAGSGGGGRGAVGGSGRPRLADDMLVPARRSLIVPFRELQPSLRQLRRVYRGTRALLMGEEEVGDRSQLAPSALATPPPRSHAYRAECAPHSRAGGHPPRRRHLSGVHALAAHWCRGLCTLCPGKAQGEAQGEALVSGGASLSACPNAIADKARVAAAVRQLCGSCAAAVRTQLLAPRMMRGRCRCGLTTCHFLVASLLACTRRAVLRGLRLLPPEAPLSRLSLPLSLDSSRHPKVDEC